MSHTANASYPTFVKHHADVSTCLFDIRQYVKEGEVGSESLHLGLTYGVPEFVVTQEQRVLIKRRAGMIGAVEAAVNNPAGA